MIFVENIWFKGFSGHGFFIKGLYLLWSFYENLRFQFFSLRVFLANFLLRGLFLVKIDFLVMVYFGDFLGKRAYFGCWGFFVLFTCLVLRQKILIASCATGFNGGTWG